MLSFKKLRTSLWPWLCTGAGPVSTSIDSSRDVLQTHEHRYILYRTSTATPRYSSKKWREYVRVSMGGVLKTRLMRWMTIRMVSPADKFPSSNPRCAQTMSILLRSDVTSRSAWISVSVYRKYWDRIRPLSNSSSDWFQPPWLLALVITETSNCCRKEVNVNLSELTFAARNNSFFPIATPATTAFWPGCNRIIIISIISSADRCGFIGTVARCLFTISLGRSSITVAKSLERGGKDRSVSRD